MNDADAASVFETLQELVGMTREVRSGAGLKPRDKADVSLKVSDAVVSQVEQGKQLFEAMTQTTLVAMGPDTVKPDNAALASGPLGELYLHVEIDADAERERLSKRKDELERAIKTCDGRLSNEKYVSKAPAHLVQETKDQRAQAAEELERVQTQLAAL